MPRSPQPSRAETVLRLHGHPFSSYTWKALIPLYANATPFQFVAMDNAVPLSAQFPGRAHPGGHIPVLEDGDVVVVSPASSLGVGAHSM